MERPEINVIGRVSHYGSHLVILIGSKGGITACQA